MEEGGAKERERPPEEKSGGKEPVVVHLNKVRHSSAPGFCEMYGQEKSGAGVEGGQEPLVEGDAVGVSGEQVKKKCGRPWGSVKKTPEPIAIAPLGKRRHSSAPDSTTFSTPHQSLHSNQNITPAPRFGDGGTSSRIKLFLLDALPISELRSAKLPKSDAVLLHFFHCLFKITGFNEHSNPLTLAKKAAVKEAAVMTVPEVKRVWQHHFGIRLVYGLNSKNGEVVLENIMITKDQLIVIKIIVLFEEWRYLEQLSRRPERAAEFKKKAANFEVYSMYVEFL